MGIILRKEISKNRVEEREKVDLIEPNHKMITTPILIVWEITESEAELKALVNEDDLESVKEFSSVVRRKERLAWRAALRQMGIENRVMYSSVGAPYLVDSPLKIAVAHSRVTIPLVSAGMEQEAEQEAEQNTELLEDNIKERSAGGKESGKEREGWRGMVAMIISENRCAVDIEPTSRNFSRVIDRFISKQEQALNHANNPLFEAAVWCAKETLYKFSNRKDIDLLDDLHIKEVDFNKNIIRGEIRHTNQAQAGINPSQSEVKINIKIFNGHIITYLFGRDVEQTRD